jgi:hypothetical protein
VAAHQPGLPARAVNGAHHGELVRQGLLPQQPRVEGAAGEGEREDQAGHGPERSAEDDAGEVRQLDQRHQHAEQEHLDHAPWLDRAHQAEEGRKPRRHPAQPERHQHQQDHHQFEQRKQQRRAEHQRSDRHHAVLPQHADRFEQGHGDQAPLHLQPDQRMDVRDDVEDGGGQRESQRAVDAVRRVARQEGTTAHAARRLAGRQLRLGLQQIALVAGDQIGRQDPRHQAQGKHDRCPRAALAQHHPIRHHPLHSQILTEGSAFGHQHRTPARLGKDGHARRVPVTGDHALEHDPHGQRRGQRQIGRTGIRRLRDLQQADFLCNPQTRNRHHAQGQEDAWQAAEIESVHQLPLIPMSFNNAHRNTGHA